MTTAGDNFKTFTTWRHAEALAAVGNFGKV
jgi:hypothetical protein